MKDGRLVAEIPADAVLTDEVLLSLYDAPIKLSRHGSRPLVLHHHWHDQLVGPYRKAPGADHCPLH